MKKEAGKIKVCSTLDAPVVRWADNKVVTVASIILMYEPVKDSKRYNRVKNWLKDVE